MISLRKMVLGLVALAGFAGSLALNQEAMADNGYWSVYACEQGETDFYLIKDCDTYDEAEAIFNLVADNGYVALLTKPNENAPY